MKRVMNQTINQTMNNMKNNNAEIGIRIENVSLIMDKKEAEYHEMPLLSSSMLSKVEFLASNGMLKNPNFNKDMLKSNVKPSESILNGNAYHKVMEEELSLERITACNMPSKMEMSVLQPMIDEKTTDVESCLKESPLISAKTTIAYCNTYNNADIRKYRELCDNLDNDPDNEPLQEDCSKIGNKIRNKIIDMLKPYNAFLKALAEDRNPVSHFTYSTIERYVEILNEDKDTMKFLYPNKNNKDAICPKQMLERIKTDFKHLLNEDELNLYQDMLLEGKFNDSYDGAYTEAESKVLNIAKRKSEISPNKTFVYAINECIEQRQNVLEINEAMFTFDVVITDYSKGSTPIERIKGKCMIDKFQYFIEEELALIIDYKTSSYNANDFWNSNLLETRKYWRQLDIYSEVIGQFIKQISMDADILKEAFGDIVFIPIVKKLVMYINSNFGNYQLGYIDTKDTDTCNSVYMEDVSDIRKSYRELKIKGNDVEGYGWKDLVKMYYFMENNMFDRNIKDKVIPPCHVTDNSSIPQKA